MASYVPKYYKEFQCQGSSCNDNCCIGWEIEIDPKTLRQYRKASGTFSDRLRQGILHRGESSVFRKDEFGRCVFLNRENLCDIYKNMGKDALCQICTQHPRFHGQYGSISQSGIGLACEEAARLILLSDRRFLLEKTSKRSDAADRNSMEYGLFAAQKHLFYILGDRFVPMKKRLNESLNFSYALQQCMNLNQPFPENITEARTKQQDFFRAFTTEESMKRWLDFYLELDCMDPSWRELLFRIKEKKFYQAPGAMDDLYYENLVIYFIYRHFMKAYEDYNLFDKVRFALLSGLLLEWINRFCMEFEEPFTSLDTARMYSKEIEYSEENLSAALEELLFEPLCSSI